MKNKPLPKPSSGEQRRPRPASIRDARAALTRVRKLCLALPETTERVSHGAPCFFVRDKALFVMFVDNHHDDGRLAIWCAAPDGMQHDLIGGDPTRFFRPPYVGHRGWIGVRLETQPDWRQIATFISDAYRIVAPSKLTALLDAPPNRLGLPRSDVTPRSRGGGGGRPADTPPADAATVNGTDPKAATRSNFR